MILIEPSAFIPAALQPHLLSVFARYVNPIQERRLKNGPVGSEVAADAAAAAPPPKPKKEPKKDAAAAVAPLAPNGGGSGSKPKPGTACVCAAGSTVGGGAAAEADCSGGALSDVEKQLRALRKKLRQIEIIEAKEEPTQEELDKASKKAEIVAALAKLQA